MLILDIRHYYFYDDGRKIEFDGIRDLTSLSNFIQQLNGIRLNESKSTDNNEEEEEEKKKKEKKESSSSDSSSNVNDADEETNKLIELTRKILMKSITITNIYCIIWSIMV